MPNKTWYCSDEKAWLDFIAFAENQGTSASAMIMQAIKAYMHPTTAEKKLQKIRDIINS